jgi:hypothetical protein
MIFQHLKNYALCYQQHLTDPTVIGGRKETRKGSEPLAVSRIVTGRLSGTDTYK